MFLKLSFAVSFSVLYMYIITAMQTLANIITDM